MDQISGDDAAAEREAMPRGSTNQNPSGIGFLQLLAEDFETYDRDLLQPGLWAIALHRFGNERMSVQSRLVRGLLGVIYKVLFRVLVLTMGIEIGHPVKLGRRVRIWHHGGIFVNAESIGNDVQMRHNTSIGIATRHEPDGLPVIEDGVDIYSGACIAGDVRVGENSLVGANAVVMADVPPNTTMFGNPARRAPTTATADKDSSSTSDRPAKARVAAHSGAQAKDRA